MEKHSYIYKNKKRKIINIPISSTLSNRRTRYYLFGDKPVEFDIKSDPRVNFPDTKTANYMDPNLNVGTPAFIIHGNHDDPSRYVCLRT